MLAYAIRAVMGGILIGISCVAYFVSLNHDALIVGSIFFAFALVTVLLLDFRLFVGAAARLPDRPLKQSWELILALIGNLAGVALVSLVVNFSSIGPAIFSVASDVVEAKLTSGILSGFLTSILCGLCIAVSIFTNREGMKKNTWSIVLLIMPIAIFVYSGFAHSIADIGYFMFAKAPLTAQTFWYFIAVFVGNALGALLIPLSGKVLKWCSKDDVPPENSKKE